MFFKKKSPPVVTDRARIEALLNRGVVAQILPSKEAFIEAMTGGKRLRFYFGADPTGTTLHLGHAGNILLLEEFRRLGHEVILLFGDFTARIGDPSGRTEARKPLSDEEVSANQDEWTRQVGPLLGFDDPTNPPLIKRNSTWLKELTFDGVLKLAANFTVQQMLERDMFANRMRDGNPIHLHEFFYPLMQGFDSVAMDVDVELAGTDQTFNMMAGRTLQKKLNNKEKFVVTTNLLADPETGEMMSKSKGTGVFLNQTASDMYGAIMAQGDAMTRQLLTNVTRVPLDEIEHILAGAPKVAKMRAAREIVSLYYGPDAGAAAEEAFDNTFSKKELPEEMEEVSVAAETLLVDALVPAVLPSKAEFRRLVSQGAVTNRDTGAKIEDPNAKAEPGAHQIGKRRFVRIRIS